MTLARKADAAPKAHLITPVIDAITTDDGILVIARGVEGISCWGDVIANAAKVKSIRWTVINGFSRDIDGSRDIGFPVYGRGVTMISACKRVTQVYSGKPLVIQGAQVQQDDYMIADRCGTVFVAAKRIAEVLDLAEKIDQRQHGMLEAVRSGRPVSEVMHDKQFAAIHDNEVASSGAATGPLTTRSQKTTVKEDEELVALFAQAATLGVSDALDKLGIPGQAFGIIPLENYKKTTVGPAFTVRYVPASDPPGSVGDFVDDVAPGDMVVIDNGDRSDCTVWADILTQYAGLRGIAGTVINGVCRDVSRA